MESISIVKGATSVKKEATKVQRQKSFFFFAQIPHAFIQCTAGVATATAWWWSSNTTNVEKNNH